VAAAVGVTRASARRLLLTLCDLGYVGSQGRQFFLRPAVLTIGYTYLSQRSMWEGAQTHLRALAAQANESCGAAVLDADEAVHVVRAVADDIMAMNPSLGSRLPAYCTAVGRVLLAELAPDALEEYFSRVALTRLTERTIVARDELRELLRQVKQQGWAIDDEEWRLGVRAIAVPIRDGASVGAIDIVCLSSRASPEKLRQELLPLLRQTAERISAGA
jgi:IclR family pca regulon transcriptional regulator